MRPTEPGYYWLWQSDDAEPALVELVRYDDGEVWVLWCGSDWDRPLSGTEGRWVGPLEPPARPQE